MYALSQENTLTPRRQHHDSDDDESTQPPPVPPHQHPLVPDEPGTSEAEDKRSNHRHHSHKHKKRKKRKKNKEHHHSSLDDRKSEPKQDVVNSVDLKAPPLYPVGTVSSNKNPPTDGTQVASSSFGAARMPISNDSTNEKGVHSPSYNDSGTKYDAATSDYERKVASSGMATAGMPVFGNSIHEKGAYSPSHEDYGTKYNAVTSNHEQKRAASGTQSTTGMKGFDRGSSDKSLDLHFYDDSQEGQSSLSDINGNSFTSKPGAVAIGPGGQEIDVESQLNVANVSDSLEFRGPEVVRSVQREAVEARCVSDNEVVRDHADEIAEMVQRKLMTNVTVPVEVNPTPPAPEPSGVCSSQRKRRAYLIVALLLMIVVALVVGVAVGLTREEAEQEPSLSPHEETFRNVLNQVSGNYLVDESTPQYRALKWIANDDTANMTVGLDSNETITTRYVAALLFFAFQGKDWTKKYGFLSKDDVCTWTKNDLGSVVPFGIGCDSNRTLIETLRLPENNLIGRIPQEIGFMSALTYVDLGNNTIGGSLTTLSNLQRLEYVDLSRNELTGTIPEFLFHHDHLATLQLDYNRLDGTISSSLGVSLHLKQFWVRDNELTSSIPSAIGQSQALESVDLEGNRLTGTIPNFLSHFHLFHLFLANNALSGTLPTSVGSLTDLQILHLSANELIGTIPTELSNCRRLRIAIFDDNSFSGDIAEVINSLPLSIEGLETYRNELGGTIPSTIGLLTKLTFLDLPENMITGILPSEIGLLNQLWLLNVADNSLSGYVPASIANLTELLTLRLEGNKFVGGLDAFCSNNLDTFVANSCDDPDRIACSCCTHCCDDIHCNQI